MKNIITSISPAICIALTFFLGACGSSTPKVEENQNQTLSATEPTTTTAEATPKTAAADKLYLIKTTAGDIKIKVFKECPLHQANFDKLVGEKYYDGVLFHRVIKEFMIQTGDPNSKKAEAGAQYGDGGPNYTIPAEIYPQFYHKKGALAAARQGDEVNPYKASSGSQFYIVHGKVLTQPDLDNIMMQSGMRFTADAMAAYKTIGGSPFLDGQYTVFGETISGLEVVDKIGTTKTLPGDRPVKDIKIITIEAVTE
ncbi:MAG: peptidylprolyl isomerase [Bacteroidota bacterium]